MPTSVLQEVVDLVAPFITELFNRSLSDGHFPARFKEAFIPPVVQKPGLDATDVNSYRPIFNLSVLSKLLERIAQDIRCEQRRSSVVQVLPFRSHTVCALRMHQVIRRQSAVWRASGLSAGTCILCTIYGRLNRTD